MHRDKKLGFALGILLIGVVGALFFRAEPDPADQLPRLQDPQKLDDQIARRRLGPYLTGIEAGESDRTGVAEAAEETASAEATGVREPGGERTGTNASTMAAQPGMEFPASPYEPWEMPDFLKEGASGTQPRHERYESTFAAPDPIPSGRGDRVGRRHPQVPKHNQAWETAFDGASKPEAYFAVESSASSDSKARSKGRSTGASRQSSARNSAGQSKAAAAGSTASGDRWRSNGSSDSTTSVRLHEVQPGDTLTELAARYLGSSARYREIFEANRHLLVHPDDVRVGMTLRIPPRDGRGSPPRDAEPDPPPATHPGEASSRSSGDSPPPPRESTATAGSPEPPVADASAKSESKPGAFLPVRYNPLLPRRAPEAR